MNFQTKAELIQELERVRQAVVDDVLSFTDAQFTTGTAQSWSAADYLKHLILSVKPTAKGFGMPGEKLRELFGAPAHKPRTYDEVSASYDAVLATGKRAEDVPTILPVGYRFPEGTTDEKAHLIQAWTDGNQRLIAAVQQLSEDDLDSYQLPHPIGDMMTLREMLYFTIHHNNMHHRDIQRMGSTVNS
jgi:hypothetical protein